MRNRRASRGMLGDVIAGGVGRCDGGQWWFPTSPKPGDMGHPEFVRIWCCAQDNSRSFAPLTPLRGAPNARVLRMTLWRGLQS
jgi:hypothetical protein